MNKQAFMDYIETEMGSLEVSVAYHGWEAVAQNRMLIKIKREIEKGTFDEDDGERDYNELQAKYNKLKQFNDSLLTLIEKLGEQ